ncbi:MAG TPA: ABC transporter permease [Vicinamibacterales bacterium]|nr:ABC transporter permease [Vicinamibacterales bacterium]
MESFSSISRSAVADVKYGARLLRRRPVFAAVAILTLAIGIGATTAIFSVVNAVLLRPLPYAAPDGLFSIVGLSYTGEFVELQRRARTFEVAAYTSGQATVTGEGEPWRVGVAFVSPNLGGLLGVPAVVGRGIQPGDEEAGDAAVVVLGHQLWRSRFGGDRRVIGTRLTVDGVARTVVGVMPGDFAFPAPSVQMWIPAAVDTRNRIALWSTSRRMIGRLRADATLAGADAELKAIAPTLRELFPWAMPAGYGRAAHAVPLVEWLVADVRPMLLTLLAAVAVVLLIASVNVGNLLVGRTLARQRELAIRTSLGASRARILRQVLTEGLLLVLAGLAAGVPLAYAVLQVLTAALPAEMPRPVALTLDVRLLTCGAVAVAASAVLVGLVPALRASRADPAPQLAGGERIGPARGTRWASNLLMGAQMALALVLTVSAVLLARTLVNLYSLAPRFAVDEVVSAQVAPPQFRFRDAAARKALYGDLLERLQGAPGVVSAALTDRLPFGGETFGSVFVIEGRPHPASTGEWPLADVSALVTPAFFSTLGIAVREGRAFTRDDTETSGLVAIVSESLARRYWPGESAIGRRFTFPGDAAGMRTIVGVVEDVPWERVTDPARGALFVPLVQGTPGPARVVVRTMAGGAAALEQIRAAVRALDRDTPVEQGRTLRTLVAGSVDQPRFAASLIGAFAVTGLLLAAVGIYGTVADQVARRRREIGIRMALGARRADVLRAVLGGTTIVVGAGALAGAAGAALAARLFSTLLVGITQTDPATFASAVLLLGVTALLGAWLPARRAATLDPLTALRE